MKRGALWRKRQILRLEGDDLTLFLTGGLHGWRCSGRAARWVYEALPVDSPLRITAVDAIGWADGPRHVAYLWRELERWKGDPFGDWVVIALCRGNSDPLEISRFTDLYHDESAHPMTRGSALYAIANRIWENWRETGIPTNIDEIRAVCLEGFKESLPYARIGAIWIAKKLGGFRNELEALSRDSGVWEGRPVADEAREALGMCGA